MADGRAAIVTGAASGMGAVMVRALAADGIRVAAVDIGADGLRALAADFEPAQVAPIEADLSIEEAPADAVARATEAFGGVDILVNNAGVGMQAIKPDYSIDPARFWEAAPDRWQRLMNINLRAPFLFARAVAPAMVAAGWGRIVNVTTSLDTMLTAGMSAYGQSKAGLEAGTAVWAKDLDGTGVTANVLVPGGPVNTAFLPANTKFPRDRLIQPDVMATPVRWLCSDAADGVTGRRFIARDWDAALPPGEAAERCSAPAGWEGLGTAAVRPDQG